MHYREVADVLQALLPTELGEADGEKNDGRHCLDLDIGH